MAERFLMARWQTVNVLQTSASGRRLWQLSPNGDQYAVHAEKTLLLNEGVPSGMVAKDWQSLFRKKLKIAWLPADKVFLRVIHLPPSDAAEIGQMIELQLEKLSPLPVGQMVWSYYLLPRPVEKADALQTVIVVIASRAAVEEFLGQLETEGYLASQLDLGLDQLIAANIQEEGAWIFPGSQNEPVLAAWWYGGTVQNLTLVLLKDGPERAAQLKTQLEQIAWAGGGRMVDRPPRSTWWRIPRKRVFGSRPFVMRDILWNFKRPRSRNSWRPWQRSVTRTQAR